MQSHPLDDVVLSELISQAGSIKTLNLSGFELGKIVPQYFDKFLLLERLDLSHNALAVLESLPTLPRLTELSLAHNYIVKLQNLSHLPLQSLNLGHNRISELTTLTLDLIRNVPFVRRLNLSANAVCQDPEYRLSIVAALPRLDWLDSAAVTDRERSAAAALYPTATPTRQHVEAQSQSPSWPTPAPAAAPAAAAPFQPVALTVPPSAVFVPALAPSLGVPRPAQPPAPRPLSAFMPVRAPPAMALSPLHAEELQQQPLHVLARSQPAQSPPVVPIQSPPPATVQSLPAQRVESSSPVNFSRPALLSLPSEASQHSGDQKQNSQHETENSETRSQMRSHHSRESSASGEIDLDHPTVAVGVLTSQPQPLDPLAARSFGFPRSPAAARAVAPIPPFQPPPRPLSITQHVAAPAQRQPPAPPSAQAPQPPPLQEQAPLRSQRRQHVRKQSADFDVSPTRARPAEVVERAPESQRARASGARRTREGEVETDSETGEESDRDGKQSRRRGGDSDQRHRSQHRVANRERRKHFQTSVASPAYDRKQSAGSESREDTRRSRSHSPVAVHKALERKQPGHKGKSHGRVHSGDREIDSQRTRRHGSREQETERESSGGSSSAHSLAHSLRSPRPLLDSQSAIQQRIDKLGDVSLPQSLSWLALSTHNARGKLSSESKALEAELSAVLRQMADYKSKLKRLHAVQPLPPAVQENQGDFAVQLQRDNANLIKERNLLKVQLEVLQQVVELQETSLRSANKLTPDAAGSADGLAPWREKISQLAAQAKSAELALDTERVEQQTALANIRNELDLSERKAQLLTRLHDSAKAELQLQISKRAFAEDAIARLETQQRQRQAQLAGEKQAVAVLVQQLRQVDAENEKFKSTHDIAMQRLSSLWDRLAFAVGRVQHAQEIFALRSRDRSTSATVGGVPIAPPQRTCARSFGISLTVRYRTNSAMAIAAIAGESDEFAYLRREIAQVTGERDQLLQRARKHAAAVDVRATEIETQRKRAHEQHAAQSAELQAQLTTAREALNQKERELFAAKTELANSRGDVGRLEERALVAEAQSKNERTAEAHGLKLNERLRTLQSEYDELKKQNTKTVIRLRQLERQVASETSQSERGEQSKLDYYEQKLRQKDLQLQRVRAERGEFQDRLRLFELSAALAPQQRAPPRQPTAVLKSHSPVRSDALSLSVQPQRPLSPTSTALSQLEGEAAAVDDLVSESSSERSARETGSRSRSQSHSHSFTERSFDSEARAGSVHNAPASAHLPGMFATPSAAGRMESARVTHSARPTMQTPPERLSAHDTASKSNRLPGGPAVADSELASKLQSLAGLSSLLLGDHEDD